MTRRSRSPGQQSDAPRSPGGPLFLWLGAAIFLVSMVAGLARSLVTYHALPRVGVEYTTELNELVRARGPAAALAQVRSAARIDFDNESAVTRLLESARQAGDGDQIVWALFAIVRLRPEDAQVRHELVSALLDQGRVAEALAQGEFVVQLDPASSAAHCNRGAALLGLGEMREAASAYRRALELDPHSQAARMALQYPLQGF